MGLKLRLWGHTGVSSIAGTLGCTMLPPAATLYAVLPVGVASIMPSAWAGEEGREWVVG